MQQMSTRSDPAPSRLRYRLHRLMLTPLFRRFLRVGVPFCLTFGLAAGYLSDAQNRDVLRLWVADLRHQIETRPEFMLRLMAVEGASDSVAEEIREIFPFALPVSSFDVDLDDVRGLVEGLPAVARAEVRIRQGGVLEVRVEERRPAAVWRMDGGLAVLDATGVRIGQIVARSERPGLPVVSGAGADSAVGEALRIRHAAAPLGERFRGLVRVGQRRWDVVLDRDQRIMLPENHPVQALERVIALSDAQDLMARDVAVVDMRLEARPTVRMKQDALEQWWRVRRMMAGKGEQ